MKLTYLLWGYAYDDAIIRAFRLLGFEIETVDLSSDLFLKDILELEKDDVLDYSLEKRVFELEDKLRKCSNELIFSVNFHAVVSEFCKKNGIPYCSWVLELPNFDLYTEAVLNECNYLGICDSYLVEKMWQCGIRKVFFLPDAVELDEKVRENYEERGFCFIAKQPEEILTKENMSLYGKGYLDSIIQAQRVLFGGYILENALPKRIYGEFTEGKEISNKIMAHFQKVFVSDKYLAPVCTAIQQNIFMKNNENIMTIYSNGSFDMCNSSKHPYIAEEKERREIYAGKEFSIVLAPHVLHHGIPRDTLEAIAAGGFPVCGFQKDYSYFFKRDEDLVYFTNVAEFQQIVVRYGNHPEERERVKERSYQVVAEGHTYVHRIVRMLEMWERL